jgi:AraC-like DNA-binding protein
MLDRSGEAALAAVLKAHDLRARVTDNASYCGHWRDREPAMDRASFHLLSTGRCWVQSSVLDPPALLGAGDLILFPRGAAHDLCGYPPGSSSASSRAQNDEFTTMLCGELQFATGLRNPVVQALPDCLVVRHADAGEQFVRLARLMCDEAHAIHLGSQSVLDKLADAMFVMAVRHHLTHAPDPRGLLAALVDPRLARALEAMHGQPRTEWTVGRLAQIAAMSRTAFAELFASLVGASPIQYLTDLRMTLALQLLNDQDLSVAAIAEQLGYESEASFRRSFKRIHGQGPGEFRRSPPGYNPAP